MFKAICFALAAILLWSLSTRAQAQEFLFCDNCTTVAQFESVAKTRPTQRGEWDYAVGNRVSGIMRYVHVSYTPAGEVPMAVITKGSLQTDGRVIVQNVIRSPYVIAPANPTGGLKQTMAGGATVWATSQPATTAENDLFKTIVRVDSTQIIVNSPSGSYGFDSLAGIELAAAGPYMFTSMSAVNPGWNYQSPSSAIQWLKEAIGWTRGKGPIACIVLNNGDMGCFQLNPMDPNAPRYITGTGKDKNGNAINLTGGLANGGGIRTIVSPGVNGTGWGVSGGSYWLFCSTVGGAPVSCYVEWISN